jgi:NADPH:quinone reductase-like Zn-dependent oxidoreductase
MVRSKYGADHIINYKKSPDWAEEVLKITNQKGVDFVIENGGSGTIAQSVKAVTYGGIVACIGFLSRAKQNEMPDVAGLTLSKGAIMRGIQVGNLQMLEDVVKFMNVRNLRMPVEKEFGFDEESVRKAYEYVQSGQHVGKVCITVS